MTRNYAMQQGFICQLFVAQSLGRKKMFEIFEYYIYVWLSILRKVKDADGSKNKKGKGKGVMEDPNEKGMNKKQKEQYRAGKRRDVIVAHFPFLPL